MVDGHGGARGGGGGAGEDGGARDDRRRRQRRRQRQRQQSGIVFIEAAILPRDSRISSGRTPRAPSPFLLPAVPLPCPTPAPSLLRAPCI